MEGEEEEEETEDFSKNSRNVASETRESDADVDDGLVICSNSRYSTVFFPGRGVYFYSYFYLKFYLQ